MGTYQKKHLSRILGVTLASVAVLAAANAADMHPAPTAAGGVVDWAGFYIGANIGGAWAELNTSDIFGLYGTPVGVFANDTSGVFGGAQLGYNFQRGNFIIGPEADLGGMGISGAKSKALGFQRLSWQRLLCRYHWPDRLCRQSSAISIREGRLRLFQRQRLACRYIYPFDRIGIGIERLDRGRRCRMEV